MTEHLKTFANVYSGDNVRFIGDNGDIYEGIVSNVILGIDRMAFDFSGKVTDPLTFGETEKYKVPYWVDSDKAVMVIS